MSGKSRRLWAIQVRNGTIATDRRFINKDGAIYSTGGASLSPDNEASFLALEKHHRPQGGPVWSRKRDAEAFLWPGEKVVQVAIVRQPEPCTTLEEP